MNNKRSHFTLDQIKKSKVAHLNQHLFNQPEKHKKETGGRIVAKHFPRASKEKDWIAWNILYWCNQHAVTLSEEYKFHAERKFRFDWAIPSLKIAVEYEGLNSEKSGHTSKQGYTKDTDKYYLAQKDGWMLIRLTFMNYKELIKRLNELFEIIKG